MTEPQVGTAGQEVLRLLRALGPSAGDSSPAHHDAADSCSCSTPSCSTSWCPVCQVADFVRANPEAIAGVTASAGAMVVALRNLLDAATSPKDQS